jgi:uncharacterized protein YaiL (DUF2058 family)
MRRPLMATKEKAMPEKIDTTALAKALRKLLKSDDPDTVMIARQGLGALGEPVDKDDADDEKKGEPTPDEIEKTMLKLSVEQHAVIACLDRRSQKAFVRACALQFRRIEAARHAVRANAMASLSPPQRAIIEQQRETRRRDSMTSVQQILEDRRRH